MTQQFSSSGINLSLCRYPSQQASNLQAWDAADEHIIKHLIENEIKPCHTAIINDAFGALSCAISRIDSQWPLVVETDAKTSQLGLLENLASNELSTDNISWCNSRGLLPDNLNLVLMKLPKNLNYFKHQLTRLSQVLPQGTQVIIGTKAKVFNKALLATIEQCLGPASGSLTWKKTRLVTCVTDGIKRPLPAPIHWHIEHLSLNMTNLSNVFSATKLDIGARCMLDNMPEGQFEQIVDLGCGNGVLGLHAKKCFPDAQIHFVDDSEMAVESARLNWQQNHQTTTDATNNQAHFYWSDCLSQLDAEVSPDLILCNPPFHQGEAITDHIAWQMFVDASRKLTKGGMLQVVGNRHLGYHIKLKRIFKNCKTVASNGKFVILQAIKQ